MVWNAIFFQFLKSILGGEIFFFPLDSPLKVEKSCKNFLVDEFSETSSESPLKKVSTQYLQLELIFFFFKFHQCYLSWWSTYNTNSMSFDFPSDEILDFSEFFQQITHWMLLPRKYTNLDTLLEKPKNVGIFPPQ